jgi:hypothetical protein
MKRFVLRAATVALALVGISGAVRADWIASGNVQMTPDPFDKANVYYAVYDNSKGDFFSKSGITAAQFGGLPGDYSSTAASLNSDKFIFVYEVLNPSDLKQGQPITAFYVQNPDMVKDAGAANGVSFAADPAGGTPTFSTAGTDSSINQAGAAIFHTPPATPALQFTYSGIGGTTGTPPHARPNNTSLMIVGADTMVNGLIQDGDGGFAFGTAPVPGPEPSTLALLGLGLPLLGWGYVRRLRASKALASAAV